MAAATTGQCQDGRPVSRRASQRASQPASVKPSDHSRETAGRRRDAGTASHAGTSVKDDQASLEKPGQSPGHQGSTHPLKTANEPTLETPADRPHGLRIILLLPTGWIDRRMPCPCMCACSSIARQARGGTLAATRSPSSLSSTCRSCRRRLGGRRPASRHGGRGRDEGPTGSAVIASTGSAAWGDS